MFISSFGKDSISKKLLMKIVCRKFRTSEEMLEKLLILVFIFFAKLLDFKIPSNIFCWITFYFQFLWERFFHLNGEYAADNTPDCSQQVYKVVSGKPHALKRSGRQILERKMHNNLYYRNRKRELKKKVFADTVCLRT